MLQKDPKTLAMYGATLLTLCLSLLAITAAYSQMVSWRNPATQMATISVSGRGEVTAVPDIALLSFTSREIEKTVPAAQKASDEKIKALKAALKKMSIEDKDIKTTSYTVNPHYEYEAPKIMSSCAYGNCGTGKQVITGYEVAQTVEVKVRKVDQAGDVLGVAGSLNITEIQGPNFTVDDKEKLIAQAKEKAITEAKAKAKSTASSLGVSLGRIVGFNDDNGGGSVFYPMTASAREDKASFESVSVSTGEMMTKVSVTITYELR